MTAKNHIIPFTHDGIDGSVTGPESDWVLFGGTGFQRSAAKDGLKAAIDEAVDDYYDNGERPGH